METLTNSDEQYEPIAQPPLSPDEAAWREEVNAAQHSVASYKAKLKAKLDAELHQNTADWLNKKSQEDQALLRRVLELYPPDGEERRKIDNADAMSRGETVLGAESTPLLLREAKTGKWVVSQLFEGPRHPERGIDEGLGDSVDEGGAK